MTKVRFQKADVDGFNVFYREAGPKDGPTILLLHGFPTSSHMFRDLIPLLADRFHLVAPDLPGFGQSDMPDRAKFNYSFDNIAKVIERFTEVIGLKKLRCTYSSTARRQACVFVSHPERITAIISQNGNAYEEGLSEGWKPIRKYWNDPSAENRNALPRLCEPETTIWQYTHGAPDVSFVSPDGYGLDNYYLARPGMDEIQLDLLGDYKSECRALPDVPEIFPRPQAAAARDLGQERSLLHSARSRSVQARRSRCGGRSSSTPVISRWKPMRKKLRNAIREFLVK